MIIQELASASIYSVDEIIAIKHISDVSDSELKKLITSFSYLHLSYSEVMELMKKDKIQLLINKTPNDTELGKLIREKYGI